MLLAIDAGNTNVVFAVMNGVDVLHAWRLETPHAKNCIEAFDWLHAKLRAHDVSSHHIKGAILSSVVPLVNAPLTEMVKKLFAIDVMVVGTKGVDIGIDVKVDNPSEVGADRLVNAVAAQVDHACPLVVVDFGTATTFDVVDAHGAYIGGVIAPGIRLSLKALHDAAAKLPLIEPAEPTGGVIGKNTVDAMRSGLFWGYVGMIEGVVDRLQNEIGQSVKVIATGGLAPTFEGKTRVINTIDKNLTLKGLALIYERNIN